MKKIIIILLLFASVASSWAYPTLSDKAQISLLTYSRTNEIHAMYGHTALRVKDSANGFDMIFNYGTFDFNSDNFVYRFVKGYTDYILSISNFEYLTIECYIRNMSINEQVLNLRSVEKQRIFDFLLTNAEPKNRVYRYNFLYDNCSTRPRIVIESNVSGKVIYKDSIPTKTFRQLIHECIDGNAWLTFGIDLVLARPLDQKATYMEQMFLPKYMEDAYSRSIIVDSAGVERKLVASSSEIITAQPLPEVKQSVFTSPNFVSILTMILVFVLSFLGFRKKKFLRGIDFALFFIYGLAGSLIFFMAFFSSHPATFPNYALFVMHPVQLIFAICCLIPALKDKLHVYHVLNTVVLSLFLILVWFLPQRFETAFLFFTFTLFFRSFFRTISYIALKK